MKTYTIALIGAAILVLGAQSYATPITSSITTNLSNGGIAGNYLWFSSVFTLPGATDPALGTHLYITNSTITYDSVTVTVPNAVITFAASGTTPTTTFNTTLNQWETTVPYNGNGTFLLDAVSFLVPATFTNYSATWTADFSTDNPWGGDVSWKWAGAHYAMPDWSTDHNALGVTSVLSGGLNAGAPTNYMDHVLKGATGGGGSNYTGSYSGTTSLLAPLAEVPEPATLLLIGSGMLGIAFLSWRRK